MRSSRHLLSSRPAVVGTLLAAGLALGACGQGADSGGSDGQGGQSVIASFYPLQFALEEVGGSAVSVETLTSPGADPHSVELSPQQLASLGEASLVVYSAGLQTAVDNAVEQQAAESSFDVSQAARLKAFGQAGGDEPTPDEHSEEDHAGEGHSEEEHADHSDVGVDPHFWLDPQRYSDVVGAIADELATIDPDNAATYEDNAAAMQEELATLDQEFEQALANCTVETVVASHAAFGYLTDRYGLEQESITGISPESEPTPARMAEVSAMVEETDATSIYAETILGPELAETIASETGAQVRQLDALEGITSDSPGDNYFEVMRANLESLRAGQDCQ